MSTFFKIILIYVPCRVIPIFNCSASEAEVGGSPKIQGQIVECGKSLGSQDYIEKYHVKETHKQRNKQTKTRILHLSKYCFIKLKIKYRFTSMIRVSKNLK